MTACNETHKVPPLLKPFMCSIGPELAKHNSALCPGSDVCWSLVTTGQYGGLVQLSAGQLKSTGPRLKTSLVRTILCSLQCNGGAEGSLPPPVSIEKYIFCPRPASPVRGVGWRVAWSASVTWPELGWEKSAEC